MLLAARHGPSQKVDELSALCRITLLADVFNLFNNVVFGGIQTNITNANFGRVSSQANTPRVGQIKVRLEF